MSWKIRKRVLQCPANSWIFNQFFLWKPCIPKKTLAGLEILSEVHVVNTKLMATRAESICSLEKYENRDSYFKGILSFVLEIFLPTNLFISAGFLFTLDNFL